MTPCELCYSQPAQVSGDGVCLCEPCAAALAVTEHEARTGTFAASGLSDITVPGILIPPLGIAQALGVPDLARRVGTAVRSHLPGGTVEPPPPPPLPPPLPPTPSGVSLADVAKVVAVGAGVVAIGAIGYKLLKSVKRPATT